MRVAALETALAEQAAHLARLDAGRGPRDDADVELVEERVEPFETDERGPLAEALLGSNRRVRDISSPPIGVPAWTDAHNFVDLAGSQAVVWGPGDFGLAHDPAEEIAVDEVVVAARTVEALLADAAGWLS